MGSTPCQLWQRRLLKLVGNEEKKNEVQFLFNESYLLWIIESIVLIVF